MGWTDRGEAADSRLNKCLMSAQTARTSSSGRRSMLSNTNTTDWYLLDRETRISLNVSRNFVAAGSSSITAVRERTVSASLENMEADWDRFSISQDATRDSFSALRVLRHR